MFYKVCNSCAKIYAINILKIISKKYINSRLAYLKVLAGSRSGFAQKELIVLGIYLLEIANLFFGGSYPQADLLPITIVPSSSTDDCCYLFCFR